MIDMIRILMVCLAFFMGYFLGFGKESYDPVLQIHVMSPLLVCAVAGISGLEGLLMGRQSARAKGYEEGSNYQKQSALAMISMSVVACTVYFLNWGFYADMTVMLIFLLFFLLSGINHALQAIMRKNYKWQNINRPVITLLMIAGLLYPLITAFQKM